MQSTGCWRWEEGGGITPITLHKCLYWEACWVSKNVFKLRFPECKCDCVGYSLVLRVMCPEAHLYACSMI